MTIFLALNFIYKCELQQMRSTKINIIIGQFSLAVAFLIFTLNFLYWDKNIFPFALSGLLFGLSFIFNLRHILIIRNGRKT